MAYATIEALSMFKAPRHWHCTRVSQVNHIFALQNLLGMVDNRLKLNADKTELGRFQTVLLLLLAADRHYGSETRRSQPAITRASSVSPSRLTSALTSTFQTQVHRAFTVFVRFEEFAVPFISLQRHWYTRFHLIPCWRLQHRAGQVVRGSSACAECSFAAARVVSGTHKFDSGS